MQSLLQRVVANTRDYVRHQLAVSLVTTTLTAEPKTSSTRGGSSADSWCLTSHATVATSTQHLLLHATVSANN
jgi:hypothetical protein